VIRKCWHGEYGSVAAVEKDVLSRLGRTVGGGEALRQKELISEDTEQYLLRAECKEFIAKEVLETRQV
jgi:hypothetical protein